ncbi:MAG: hypothetical protein J6X70_06315 [Muribaculaceae bacterium]|nr:hypothetical protein [Muribaculaceae bacterium]
MLLLPCNLALGNDNIRALEAQKSQLDAQILELQNQIDHLKHQIAELEYNIQTGAYNQETTEEAKRREEIEKDFEFYFGKDITQKAKSQSPSKAQLEYYTTIAIIKKLKEEVEKLERQKLLLESNRSQIERSIEQEKAAERAAAEKAAAERAAAEKAAAERAAAEKAAAERAAAEKAAAERVAAEKAAAERAAAEKAAAERAAAETAAAKEAAARERQRLIDEENRKNKEFWDNYNKEQERLKQQREKENAERDRKWEESRMRNAAKYDRTRANVSDGLEAIAEDHQFSVETNTARSLMEEQRNGNYGHAQSKQQQYQRANPQPTSVKDMFKAATTNSVDKELIQLLEKAEEEGRKL